MLVAIIPVHSIESAQALMHQASGADVFEFRFDFMLKFNLDEIKKLRDETDKQVLFTLRKSEQGGVYKGKEVERLQLIEKLITLKPDYFDIEHDVPIEFCKKLKSIAPTTKLMCSYHNFIHTPDDLPQLLQQMMNPIFSAYKIITTANSILDTLRILDFVKNHNQQITLTAHAMGEVGVTSRILGKILGNYFTYSTVNEENIASGLVSLDDFIKIYHYHDLNQYTKIYGLIGDPVSQSIGHIFHNQEFIKHHQNAVYVKFQVKPDELALFFKSIQNLAIEGISVTMPHKQAVLAFCNDATDDVKAIGAANTLIKTHNGYLAANTDGDAVVQILPAPLKDKKIVILGAGGAASSIIYSLKKVGAKLEVFNRTAHPGVLPLETAAHADYDILINTIPAKYYNQNFIRFIPNKIIMDANYQATPTPLIQDAAKHGCICIEGQAMFYAQAQLQRQLWFTHNE
ncbi:MAG: type I 3-dehydroquinate dehydratase [Gammaproteobacteria bacterium]|jgi:3-dehydroquinate dehydratase/shikimate dehydrogenase